MAMKFDLNSRGTQVTLIVLGTVFMGFMAFSELSKNENETQVKIYNPDKNLSQYELLKKRTLKNRERKVSDYSLEEMFANQIKKDPFKRNEPITVDTAGASEPPETGRKVAVVKPKPRIKPVQIEKQKPKKRRHGFSTNPESLFKTKQSGNHKAPQPKGTEIPAVVHQQSEVRSGDNIILRTTKKGAIGSNIVPANTMVTGTVSLNRNRLKITINGIQLQDRYLKKELAVYDVDGVLGLRLSNDLSYELKNDGANSVIDEVSRQINIPYLGALSKSLAKKKVNDPRIPIRKGHPIIIKEKI